MESKFGSKVHIMDHPLVAHKLTIMRDKNTSVKDFRELVSEIGMLITYEATRDLPLTTKHIETPICEMDAPTLAGRKFVVVPILRAGLGLVDGVLRMVPSARVGHIGMYRDEETLEPHPYFCKMPKDVAERDVLIVDPMLATGGSAAEAMRSTPARSTTTSTSTATSSRVSATRATAFSARSKFSPPRRRPRRKARSSVLRSKTLPQGGSSTCGFDPRRGFAPRIGAKSRATASSARSKFSPPRRRSGALRGRLLSQTAI